MKKIGLITSLLGFTTLSSAIVPLTSCSCSVVKIKRGEHITSVTYSPIYKNDSFTIEVTCDDGYELGTIIIKINDKTLSAGTDYKQNYNSVTVFAAAVTDTSNIYIEAIAKKK